MGGDDIEYPDHGTTLDKAKWYLGLGGPPDPTPFWATLAIVLPVMLGCILVANWLINDHWLTNLGAIFVTGMIADPLLRRAQNHYAGLSPEGG